MSETEPTLDELRERRRVASRTYVTAYRLYADVYRSWNATDQELDEVRQARDKAYQVWCQADVSVREREARA